jgi:3-phenylpropionate/trans-cinnamate dioxygenase ferredoxin subunit
MGEPTRTTLGPADLSEGELRAYSLGARRLLVARVADRFLGLDDWCNHSGCSLSGGRIEGDMVVCPCHLIGFELATGRNVTSPRLAGDQRSYPIELVADQLVVVGFTEA